MLAGAQSRSVRTVGSGAVAPIGLIVMAACCAIALGGCSQSFAVATFQTNPIRAAIEHGDMHSPKPAAVAFSSIEGAPDEVLSRFRSGVTQEAGAREITISDPALARYFLRGYLDAFPTEQGTSVRFVWDVFDASKRRVERLDDALDLPKSDGDPWAIVDDKVLSSMASRSADVIAAYLATTPEAVGSTPPMPAGSSPSTAAASAAAVAAKPIGPVN